MDYFESATRNVKDDLKMRKYAPLIAAAVNGGLIVLLPGLVTLFLRTTENIFPPRYGSTTVVAASPLVSALYSIVTSLPLTGFVGSIAVWRTLIHGIRWQRDDHTWVGVAEAGAAGFLLVAVLLLPGVLVAAFAKQSLLGFALIPFYAIIGGVVGLALGLLLQLSAMAVFKVSGSRFT